MPLGRSGHLALELVPRPGATEVGAHLWRGQQLDDRRPVPGLGLAEHQPLGPDRLSRPGDGPQVSHARRLQTDAVTQGLTTSWSSGPVEGRVDFQDDQAPDVRPRRPAATGASCSAPQLADVPGSRSHASIMAHVTGAGIEQNGHWGHGEEWPRPLTVAFYLCCSRRLRERSARPSALICTKYVGRKPSTGLGSALNHACHLRSQHPASALLPWPSEPLPPPFG